MVIQNTKHIVFSQPRWSPYDPAGVTTEAPALRDLVSYPTLPPTPVAIDKPVLIGPMPIVPPALALAPTSNPPPVNPPPALAFVTPPKLLPPTLASTSASTF